MTKLKGNQHLRTLEHIFDFRNQNHEEYISFSKIWTQPESQKKKKKKKKNKKTWIKHQVSEQICIDFLFTVENVSNEKDSSNLT